MVNVKEFIKRVGIRDQDELAERLGVAKGTISMWATGKRNPTYETGRQLLEMGMTVEELYGKAYPSTVADLNQKSDTLEYIADSLKSLSDSLRGLKP